MKKISWIFIKFWYFGILWKILANFLSWRNLTTEKYGFSHLAYIIRCKKSVFHNSQQWFTVMWSETVGLRTRPVWDQKKSVLVLQIWCSVVKHGLVTLVVIMILKDTATFHVLHIIVSLFCAWNITTVEINCGVYLLRIKFVKCLCLLPVVLVLVFRIWSCLHHW